ncbi:MAG: glycosyltransferase family 39 protein [Chloroflexi bacterium]|nr:glycosyltransferase family 39 protein [Chloroflexota bacterium]
MDTHHRAHSELLWLAGCTLLGAVLRLVELGAPSLWLDELFSVFVARGDWAQVIAGTLQGDTNPPLFNLLLNIALQFGANEIAARSVSAVCGIAAIPLFYLLARRMFDSVRVANVATLLLATNPFHIAYAQEARMYALLAVCQLAAIYFFDCAWENDRRGDWVMFGVCQTLAFYSHSLAILNLIALAGFGVWHWRMWRTRWRGWLLAHGIIGALFAPWLWMLTQQANRVLSGFWNPPSTILNLLRTPYILNFNTALPALLVPIGLVVVLLLFFFGLYWVARALMRETIAPRARVALHLALAIFLAPPIALLAISLIRPVYIERVLIASTFGLFLIWAWVWTQRPHRFERIVLAIGALLLIIAFGNYYRDPAMQKPPMRQAAYELAARWQPGEAVIHTSDWSALAFTYYTPAIPHQFLAGDPAYGAATTRAQSGYAVGLVPKERDALVANVSRVWLVVALDHSETYQQARVDEFNARYARLAAFELQGIYLFSYQIPGSVDQK